MSPRGGVVVYIAPDIASISTTIESRKFRIPSDLRRQPGYRPVSSKVGDHLRILLGVVVHIPFALFAPHRLGQARFLDFWAEFPWTRANYVTDSGPDLHRVILQVDTAQVA